MLWSLGVKSKLYRNQEKKENSLEFLTLITMVEK